MTTNDLEGKIELRDISKILPYEENAKIHSPEQVKALAAMIKRWGWTQPIVIQKSSGFIIAGHGRRLAAIELGLTRVPVNVLDVTDAEARALRLADNRVTSTDYDAGKIQGEIYKLNELGYDLDILNFSENELAFLTDDLGEMAEDSFVGDISEAVETQKRQNEERQRQIEESDAPISKAFGFKRLTVGEGRRVKAFMTAIEKNSGKTGVPALMAHLDSLAIA